MKFIPLDYSYIDDEEGKPLIQIFGKTEKNERICVLDSFLPFFYIIPKISTKLDKFIQILENIVFNNSGRKVFIEKVEKCKKLDLGKEVNALKITASNPKDIQVLREHIKELTDYNYSREADVNFITRYITERKVKPLAWYEIEGEEVENSLVKTIKVKKIKETTGPEFNPKVLAFDIETDSTEINKGNIFMLSLVGEKFKKVITYKKFKNAPKEIEFVKDEKELLLKFQDYIHKEEPDILTGYFSDGFDLPYLREKFSKHNIKFDISWDGSNMLISRGAINSAKFSGLVHIDIFKFVSGVMSANLNTETLSLNDVSKELLGEQKVQIEFNPLTFKEKVDKMNDQDLKEFSFYNLQDSVLAFKLFEKLWPMMQELTKLIQEPLFTVTRNSYTQLMGNFVLHNLDQFNELAQNKPKRDEILERRNRPKSEGAFVLEPKFGLYENMVVFDFSGMYTSILITFNVDPSTIEEVTSKEKSDIDFELEGKRRYFKFNKKRRGIFPALIEDVFHKRKEIKNQLKKKYDPILSARSYILKILGSATHGYFRFFGSRWHSQECAASLLAFARKYILESIENVKKQGYNVVYSDTDSIMFERGKKTQKDVLELLATLNKKLPGLLELELEDFYTRGLFVSKRTVKTGAKKKYALLSVDHKMKIRGFETIRRDWCKLAKEVQSKVLRQVLEQGKPEESLKYVQKIIKEIKEKKIPNEKMIILTQLKKEIDEYTAIGPHVAVAKKMQKKGIPVGAGTLLGFIIAGKGKLVRDRAELPEDVKEKGYDSEYYVKRQIIPAVENIFEVFGIKAEELEGKKQKSLGDF
ncbi:MAG: DNA-directed DNA polymerase [archaeon]